jgi:hypothetical protein
MSLARLPFGVVALLWLSGCGSGDSNALFSGATPLGAGGAGIGGASSGGGGATASGGTTASGGDTASSSGGTASGGTTSIGGASGGPSDSGSTQPGCKAGTFKGTLTGSYLTGSTILPANLTLNLPLTGEMHPSSTPGLLDFDASGSGNYSLVVPYSGHIVGQINCATGAVQGGVIEGSYGSAPTATSFSGTATGILDAPSGVLAGAWDAKEANPTYGGSGTWTVTVQ